MTQLAVETTATLRRTKRHKESPLGFFIAFIQERLELPEREHRKRFKQLVLNPEFEVFLDAIIDEWIGIKYSTALRAAQPVSTEAIAQSLKQNRVKQQEKDAAITRAKSIMGIRLLDLTMPNGKFLRDCTGAQCIKFGGFYAAIGKQIGPRALVGKNFSNEEIMKVWKEAQ